MSLNEPSLSDVHADLKAHLELDKRMREVEIRQASLDTGMDALSREVKTMRDDVLAELRDLKSTTAPKPIWPAVASLASVAGVLFVFFAALYSK